MRNRFEQRTNTDRQNEQSCSYCAAESGTTDRSIISPGVDVATSFGVVGLSCGGCASSVEKAVSTLEGVNDVSVKVVTGGTSTLTILGQDKIEFQSVADLVGEAGYAMAAR